MHARTHVDTSEPAYRRHLPMPKWNGLVSIHHEPRVLRRLPEFARWTRADHLYASETARAAADEMDRSWSELVEAAVQAYGSHGSLISGVYRDHFPPTVKDQLRVYAQEGTFWRGVSLAHWKAAGKRGSWLAR